MSTVVGCKTDLRRVTNAVSDVAVCVSGCGCSHLNRLSFQGIRLFANKLAESDAAQGAFLDKYASTTLAAHNMDVSTTRSVHLSYGARVPGPAGRNDRLAEAIARAGLGVDTLADAAAVDRRTVLRWVEDRSRIPRAVSRAAMADLLRVPAVFLWPSTGTAPQTIESVAGYFPTRALMPASYLMTLVNATRERIDVLALAAMWLWDSAPDFGSTLRLKRAEGVAIRLCLGDPSGCAVERRGHEEGLGELMSARCRISLRYAGYWLEGTQSAVRIHDTSLYATILRFDDDVLLNWHLYGLPAADAPVIHAQVGDERSLANRALESFERVWSDARPVQEG